MKTNKFMNEMSGTHRRGSTLVNGSMFDRCSLVVDSLRSRFSLDSILSRLCLASLICLCMLTLGGGNAWGAPTTYTFNSSIPTTGWSSSGGSQTINSKSWTYSSSTYIGAQATRIQVGSKKNPQTSAWTIQTAVSNFGSGKKITAVAITAYTTATTATYDISVGGSSVKSGSLSTASETYAASSLNVTSGDIVITMTGSDASKAIYLENISVTYDDAAPAVAHTVTYNAGTGSCKASETEASAGAGVTLPTPTHSCYSEGWSFAGWTTGSLITTETDEAPATLYSGGSTYNPSDDITLYAVYKRGDGKYHLVTTLPIAEDIPGNYMIVNTSAAKAMDAYVVSNYYLDADATGTITSNAITPANVSYFSYNHWKVTYESSKWIFYNESTNKYLYNYNSTYKNLGITATKPNGYTITLEDGYAVFASADISGANVFYDSSNARFAGNNSSTKNLHLYKEEPVTYYSNPVCADCEADPTVGVASLNSSFSSTSVGVQVTTASAGTNCSYTDYGFVWSTTNSTTSNLILNSDGTAPANNTKVQVGTSGTATSFSGNLTGTFSAGTTYYYRAFVHNGKAGGAYVYSSSVSSFVPRSITFNSNGGSEVEAILVASGTAATEPTAPTKAGFNFGGWYLESNLATPVNWSSNITENKTYYAKWNNKTATVTLDGNGATTPGTATITATCWVKTVPAITNPSKTGYDFAGWFSGEGGTGNMVINAAGVLQTNVSGYTDEDGYWRREADVTLYAKWNLHAYDVTWSVNGSAWSEGTPSTSADYNTRVTTLPTAPESSDCDGSKVFVGWTNAAIGSATDERPAVLFTSAGASPLVTSDVTYHAVFANTGGGVSTDYAVFSGVLEEGDYVICDGSNALKNTVTSDRFDYAEVTISEGVISNPAANVIWHIAQSGDYWTIYNDAVSKYAAAQTAKNKGQLLADGTDDKSKWSCASTALSTNYDFENKSRAAGTDPGNKWLRKNGSYGFACYADATGNNLTLYKRSTSYTGYITNCCNDAAVVTLTPTASKIYRAANGTATTTIICSQTGGGAGTWGNASVSPSANASVSLVGNTITFSATATGTYTITATYTETCAKAGSVKVTVYNKVSWMVNGLETTEGDPTTEVFSGGGIDVMPTPPDGDSYCGGKVFVGWTTDDDYSGDVTPTPLYQTVSDMSGVTISASTNYYAVFAAPTDGTGATTTYKRASSLSEIVSASSLIFVNPDNNLAMNSTLGTTAVTPSTIGGSYYITNPAATIVWTKSGNNSTGFTFTCSGNTVGTDDILASSEGSLTTSSPTYSKWLIGEQIGKGADKMYVDLAEDGADATVLEYHNGWKTYFTESYTTNNYCGIYIYVPGGLEEYAVECGPSLHANAVERLTSTKDQTVKSQAITVRGNNLLGSTLSHTITGTGAAHFSVSEAATTITDGAITTTYVVSYTPTVYGGTGETHTATLQFKDNAGTPTLSNSITLRGRSLPAEFAICAKNGDDYYALDGGMGTAGNPEALPVTITAGVVDECPARAVYTLEDLATPTENVYLVGPNGRLWGAINDAQLNNNNAAVQTTWLLATEDFSTYHVTNGTTTTRGVMMYNDVFGHYTTSNYGVGGYYGDLYLLPISTKCTCLEAPVVNITAKSTTVILKWLAIEGAGSYTVTCVGGTVGLVSGEGTKTCTITGLTANTDYTITVKANAATGTDCSKTFEAAIHTPTCDDVPTLEGAEAGIMQAIIRWTSESTATVEVYTDEACAVGDRIIQRTGKTSPDTVVGLSPMTTYYYKVFGGGTCPSSVGTFTTKEAEMGVISWDTDSITISFDEGQNAKITIADQQPVSQKTSNVANDLFFSKYFEAKANTKLIAIYNGTANAIPLDNVRIIMSKGKTWADIEANSKTEIIELSYLTSIPAGTEYIFFTSQKGSADKPAIDCVAEDQGWSHANWFPTNNATAELTGTTCPFPAGHQATVVISGDRTMALQRKVDDEWTFIDMFGVGDEEGADNSAYGDYDDEECTSGMGKLTDNVKVELDDGTTTITERNDDVGWWCRGGHDLDNDTAMVLSTNRYYLVRKNTVKDGLHAVESNTSTFATLCEEWVGKPVGKFSSADDDSKTTCKNFQDVGVYNYNEYYVKYDTIHKSEEFDEEWDNGDGTYTIPVPRLDTMACTNLFIELSDASNNVISKNMYKVPIMVSKDTMTTSMLFRSYGRTKAKCKTCDVVVLPGAKLIKATDGTANDVDSVRDVKVYNGGKLDVPTGTHYHVNSLAMRRKYNDVSKADIKGTLDVIKDNSISMDILIDGTKWFFISLPYNCAVNDITFASGAPAEIGKDFRIQWYDGETRAANKKGGWKDLSAGAVLQKGKGYTVGVCGEENIKKELRFPMSNDLLDEENSNKTIGNFYAYGGDKTDEQLTPNHKGWNLIGNPYLLPYTSTVSTPLMMGHLDLDGTKYTRSGNLRYIVEAVNNGLSGYVQTEIGEGFAMPPFTSYFIQVGGVNNATGGDNPATAETVTFTTGQKASIQRRVTEYAEEDNHPIWMGVKLVAEDGQSDRTSLLLSNQFTDDYDMMDDLIKMRGTYYKYAQYNSAPVLASQNIKGEMAFNALPDSSAAQVGVPLSYYAPKAGTFTFTLDERYGLDEIVEASLYDKTMNQYYDLLHSNYSFSTAKGDNTDRFRLFVRVERKAPEIATDIDNLLSDGELSLTAIGHTLVLSGLTHDSEVFVYDMSGKLLTGDRANGNTGVWRASVPAQGVYFVRVNSAAGQQTLRTIVK